MVPILPFIEQDNLYKNYINFGGLDTSGPRYNSGVNAQVTSTRLKAFSCPSDEQQVLSSGGVSLTKHNYVLNAGNTTFYQVALPLGCTPGRPGCTPFLGAPFGWYTGSDLVWDSTVPWDVPPPRGPNPVNGKMGVPVKLGEITDGTSNTMMASEAIQGRGNDVRGLTWWGGAAGFTTYMAPNSIEQDVCTPGPCTSLVSPRMPCTETSTPARPRLMGARSNHSGGLNAAMCDGSVRFVRDSIPLPIWQAISTTRGGEVTSGDN
jgi:prepilin-type processing-associated H-X9-DG protein